MIFGKDTPKYCCFCENSHDLGTNDEMSCIYKGVVDKAFSCRKFKYDPLKRTPAAKPVLKGVDSEDFSL